MKISRRYWPMERYWYDTGMCSYQNGFAQVDTRQDASYFGTWANPTTWTIVTYAEGDETVQQCESLDEFRVAMHELIVWNDEAGWGPVSIDVGRPFDHDKNPMAKAFIEAGCAQWLA